MATENVSYKDVLIFKKNNRTTAFTFSDVVRSPPPIPNTVIPITFLEKVNIPSLNENHHFFNSGKPKLISRHPLNNNKINLPFEL